MTDTPLTTVGVEAMAQELLRLASNGEQTWEQATPELQEELLGYVDSMVDKAADAEAAVADATPTPPTREEPTNGKAEDHQAEHQVRPAAGEDPGPGDQGHADQDRASAEAQALITREKPSG
jgi:hypothetical protein